MPSRHYLDAKTRAWLAFADEQIASAIADDARYFDGAR